MAYNKAVKPFACGSLGRLALCTCSGMASPLLPDQARRAKRRLPGRYVLRSGKKNAIAAGLGST
ncbi:MAG: hypothetical protein H6953_15150 [Chromatiaceae bacterium]|nr:hypothetical protein [Chromatiaceae bacterium]